VLKGTGVNAKVSFADAIEVFAGADIEVAIGDRR
jgi:hypothetical protein